MSHIISTSYITEAEMARAIAYNTLKKLCIKKSIRGPVDFSLHAIFTWLSRKYDWEETLTCTWKNRWTYNADWLRSPISVFALSLDEALYSISIEIIENWYRNHERLDTKRTHI